VKRNSIKVRERLRVSIRRVTNIDPLPTASMEQLYRERKDDKKSIRLFIAAQPQFAE
jgi:hypothetical protein